MKVTIIYDNTSSRADLKADWGFSALVEIEGRKLLFDTGANGKILLSNMQKLKINPAQSAKEFFEVKKPARLNERIYSTGELEGIEQSLCVETGKGIVIIVGCSHPPIARIRETASQFGEIYGIIGGLHGNRPETLKNLGLICASHCTQYKSEIKSLYPEKYIEGGAGKIIEVE